MSTPNIFFTSDCHFHHKNIINFCNRPWDNVDEMNEGLIAKWNETVAPGDTVWSLGDFAFTKIDRIEGILSRLHGDIHMILGNHDKEIIQNRQRLLDSGLVKSIQDYKLLRVPGGPKIALLHYAMREWDGSHHGNWHLFGHAHGNTTPSGRSVDVGFDSPWVTGKAEHRPFHISEIAAVMSKVPVKEQRYE